MLYAPSWALALLALNLSLQVWDGLATYYGLSRGIPEGNLLLRACMDYWGVGVTMVGAKSAACMCLVSLYKLAHFSLSLWGLRLTAVSYVLCSFLPWCVILFT